MCFSPGADAVVGGIVVVIGADALRHVREPKQILLASLPDVRRGAWERSGQRRGQAFIS